VKTNIGTAYVQILPTTDGITGQLTSALKGPMGQVGKSCGASLGSALKGGLVTAAKVGGAAIAAASGGVIAMTAQAVRSYADYEQLVGGVETLFKDSADQVKQYAADAYKTAGMSANEYMETVTGFSASLLQSLGGDTKAAAEMADMAITDMADNANKMGSDMASIQNAYQGFAKQNYTMLDNLKLGYGGTKEEMARLLADAEAISGIHYDIESYADVVEAIHVIQTEMGITGTTAKEASETISGSLATLKGAWQNLLVGMADPAADIDTLIDNLVESAGTAAENLMPAIEHALTGMAGVVEKLAPIIAEKLPQFISDVLPALIHAATALVTGLIRALPEIVQVLIDEGPTIVKELGKAIIETAPVLLNAAAELIGTILMGLVDGFAQLLQAGADVVSQIGQGIKNKLREAWQWGKDLIGNFIQGIKDKAAELWATIKGIAGGVKDFLGFSEPKLGPLSDFHTYAPDMMALYAQGIRENAHLITDQIGESFDVAPVIMAAGETPRIAAQGAAAAGGGADLGPVVALLAEYLPILASKRWTVDGASLARSLAPAMDEQLGMIQSRKGRESYGAAWG
jgi:hypothetical protein